MKILLDCGMYQGRRQESYEKNKTFEYYKPEEIDIVLLSHAHIDHSGNLPNLVKNGFKGKIFCTDATRDLCQIMLPDSARIQEHDAYYLNKHKKTSDPLILPLYTEADAENAMKRFVSMNYDVDMYLGPGLSVTFYDAGHILGASQIVLDIEDQEDGKKKRLLFSGDVGRGQNDILRDPEVVQDVDIFLIESTYGGVEHDPILSNNAVFLSVLERALARGGKIYIPSFAVERTQQVLYILHRLFKDKKLKRIPVYVDSPLAVSATEIFRLHPECFNEEIGRFMQEVKDPFGFDNLRLIRPISQSKELNKLKGQAIIIAASGMCEAGRILFHLTNGIENPQNTILFVGYCAEHTLGWKIRNGWTDVNILGAPYTVRASVEIMDSFSGHAGHSELVNYFERTGGKKSKVFIVHGEPDRGKALEKTLNAFHDAEYHRPAPGDEFSC